MSILNIKDRRINCACRRSALGGGQLFLVLIAHTLRNLVVKKRKESVAAAARHRRHLMQERARKYDRVAGRRAVCAIAEFRKAKTPPFVIRVQIDRHGEAAVSDNRGRVVTVRPEIATRLGVVTADEIPLDARRPELKGAKDHRQKPALEKLSRFLQRAFIRD